MLVSEMGILARISPNAMVMADPKTGTKAKKPIHAPRPAMKRVARPRSFCLTCSYFSIHSNLLIRPMK